MKPEDFLTEVANGEDPWGLPTHAADTARLTALRQAPLDGVEDLNAAIALTALVHDDLKRYGTDGSQRLTNDEVAHAIRALTAVLRRLGVDFALPWRDLETFHTYWVRNGCSGSWQARRDLLEPFFEPVHARLMVMEDAAFEASLVQAVSPHHTTGWPKVDDEIRELRRRFLSASTPQDYRAIGTHCVGVLEALSRTVYDPAVHLRDGETEPPADRSAPRIERYIEHELPGGDNEEVRGVAKKAVALAHKVKHRETPSRRDAGIAADSVILLANILRRLAQEF